MEIRQQVWDNDNNMCVFCISYTEFPISGGGEIEVIACPYSHEKAQSKNYTPGSEVFPTVKIVFKNGVLYARVVLPGEQAGMSDKVVLYRYTGEERKP